MQRKIRQAVQEVGLACVAGSAWYIEQPQAAGAIMNSPFDAGGPITINKEKPFDLDIDGDGTPDVEFSLVHANFLAISPLTGDGTSANADTDTMIYHSGDTVSYSGSFRTSVSSPLNDYLSKAFAAVKFELGGTGSQTLGAFALVYNGDDASSYTLSDVFYQTRAVCISS